MENHNIEKSYSDHVSATHEVINAIQSTNFDTAIDYAEIGLDSFVTDEVLKEIPIVKTVVGFAKGALKIREIHFSKKLLSFLREFHSGKLPEGKMTDFRIKFNDDCEYREKVVEQIMIYNDRFIDIQKATIYANLFLAHLNGKYGWADFLSLSNCLEKMNLSTLDFLHEMSEQNFYRGFSQFNDNVALLASAGMMQQWGTHIQVTAHGQYIYFYGIVGDIHYTFPEKVE